MIPSTETALIFNEKLKKRPIVCVLSLGIVECWKPENLAASLGLYTTEKKQVTQPHLRKKIKPLPWHYYGLCKRFPHRRLYLKSHDMTKTNKMSVRPAKTQLSLGIRPVWSESLLCAQWVAKGPMFLHADSEDSDQTGRMPRLIWVFAGRALTLLVLTCRGSQCL